MEFDRLIGESTDDFIDGFNAAERDWNAGNPYASHFAERSGEWKDGYAYWLRFWRYRAARAAH